MRTIPEKMQCIEVKGTGEGATLELAERPVPQIGAGQVLIAVIAAGVNRADTTQRRGLYPPPPGASDILGLEVAGTVVACGAGVTTPSVGSHVCALISGGGYAEFAAVAASVCLPIPDGLDVVQAAALPEVFMTVWHNVFERGCLKAGETLLVHGGTSGIGTAAIQLAKAFRANVVVTVGSDRKREACLKLGATQTINYRTTDFVAEVCSLPSKGADVILDMIGGSYIQRNIACLRPDGRLVHINFQDGSAALLDLKPLLFKRLTLTGSTLRSRDDVFKAALAANVRDNVWPLIARREIVPVIDSVLPLAQAAEAHRRIESSAHIGKILLQPTNS